MFIFTVHRLGVVEAVENFKLPVYGDNGDEESAIGNGKASNASKKRKPVAENTAMESAKSYCSCKLIVTPSASKMFLNFVMQISELHVTR